MKNAKTLVKWTFGNLAAVATAVVLSGCEMEQYFIRLQKAGGIPLSSETPTPEGTFARESCGREEFVQPILPSFQKIDVLLVTDTSASLDPERRGIADGIRAFVDALPQGSDIQFAVLLAHAESQWSGRLYRAARNPTVLGHRLGDTQKLSWQKHLWTNLTQVPSEYVSDGGEAGLLSFYKSLQGEAFRHNRNWGFFRDDAALAVIFISDEQDLCWEYPSDTSPVPDLDHLEGSARQKFCTLADGSRLNPERVLRHVKSVMGERPVIFSAITYTETSLIPAGVENEIGYGYNDLVKASPGGILIDMADGRFSEGLAAIGDVSKTKMSLITDVRPSESPVVESTIRVAVDGQVAPFSYQPVTNEIHIEEPGRPGSHVSVEYCVETPERETQ